MTSKGEKEKVKEKEKEKEREIEEEKEKEREIEEEKENRDRGRIVLAAVLLRSFFVRLLLLPTCRRELSFSMIAATAAIVA